MGLADDYLTGLKARWAEIGDADSVAQFGWTNGATTTDLARLRSAFPQCPDTLIGLLGVVDGTDYRDYDGHTVGVPLFGRVGYLTGYELRSTDRILRDASDEFFAKSIRDIYGDDLDEWLPVGRDREPGKGHRDDRINPDVPLASRLRFAQDMGGDSGWLMIDFNPAGEGTVGQIIQYVHDPDSYSVLAGSFDDYLHTMMDDGYPFADPDYL